MVFHDFLIAYRVVVPVPFLVLIPDIEILVGDDPVDKIRCARGPGISEGAADLDVVEERIRICRRRSDLVGIETCDFAVDIALECNLVRSASVVHAPPR
jgi:hypothetical protein